MSKIKKVMKLKKCGLLIDMETSNKNKLRLKTVGYKYIFQD
jgi:hypothetical protein